MSDDNKFKLVFKLKQHTPLIHFQADQKGATLRATELKPKLDKYLFDNCFKDKKKSEPFLIPKGTNTEARDALAYKVTVTHARTEPVKGPVVDKNPLYFGNMGKEETEKKQFIYNPNNIEVTIFSYKTKLLEIIKDNLCAFFSVTNFGTRQNKGFGSYYISGDSKEYSKNIEEVLPPGTPYLEVKSMDNNVLYALIDTYYKRLKSGINLNFPPKDKSKHFKCRKENYHKSFLYQYLDDESNQIDYTWEKRWIKETFFELKPDSTKKEPRFARALLGLPGSYTYKETDEPCNPNQDDRITIKKKVEIEVKSNSKKDAIERIKSPITFKVIKTNIKTKIYILVSKTDKKLFEKKRGFEFTQKSKDKKSDTIYIPSADINVEDLLKQYHNHLENKLYFQLRRKGQRPLDYTAEIKRLGEKST